jgi:hypothetical protein
MEGLVLVCTISVDDYIPFTLFKKRRSEEVEKGCYASP